MGILFVTKTWAGRNERWIQRMVHALADDLASIVVSKTKGPLSDAPVAVTVLPSIRPSISQRLARRVSLPAWAVREGRSSAALKKAVQSKHVDRILIHFADFALRFEDVWKATDKPLFVHCHGYDVTWDLRSHESPSKKRYDSEYPNAVCRLAERAILIANSQNTRQRLLDAGVRDDRIVVKYLGVPVCDPPRRHTRSEVTILYLGRLIDCKGPDLVIQAFDLACRRGLQGRLVMAGDGPLRLTCELLRARSPYAHRIQLLGTVPADEGDRLRVEADIFTAHNCVGPLTHQEEAYGVSVVEAMAAGLPVLTGRTSALCETVVDGKTGILFDPGDVETHAEELLRLAREPELRERMGCAAQSRVSASFSDAQERQRLREILSSRPAS